MWLTLALRYWWAIALAVLTLALGVQTKRLHSSQAETMVVQARFDAFTEQVKTMGEQQIAKNKEIAAKQEKINRETVKSADARVVAVLDRYNRLLNQKGDSGRGDLPAVPDTASPVDDAARNQRLLEVLRAADIQTGQLIELQNWVRQTK